MFVTSHQAHFIDEVETLDAYEPVARSKRAGEDALRERIPGSSQATGQGVSVEVGEKQAAIDLDIVTEYGVAIAEVARAVRRNVISALERMTGLEVVEVNISVDDVHLPSEDDGKDEEPKKIESTSRVA